MMTGRDRHKPPPDEVGPASPVGRPSLAHVLLLVAVCTMLFLFRASALPLVDPEESRCALIVREMQTSGDWIVPHLNGRPYFDKPAPFFWLAAAGQEITGSEELGGRLVVALAALGCVLVTWAFGRRLFGDTGGLLGGLILATSGGFFFLARWYRMDMPFAAAMWAALWWLWRAERTGESPVSRWRGWVGFYFFTAVATLFKGPAGLGLPLLTVAAYLLLSGRPGRLLGMFHPVGIGLYLLIAAPWYVAVSLCEPGYAYEFFIRQNILRYTGGGNLGHTWPGVLYILVLLGGLIPWTIYLPGIAIRYFPRTWRQLRQQPDLLLLWLGAVVTITFFAFSQTKLVTYILPAFPPLAVLMGGLIATWTTSHRPDPLLRHGARALTITILVLPLPILGVEIYLGNLSTWIALPLVVCVLAAWSMRTALARAKRQLFLRWAMAAIVVIHFFLVGHEAPAVYNILSTRSLAAMVPPHREDNRKIYLWATDSPSFLFYTRTDRTTELARSDPDSLPKLQQAMQSDRPVYCLISGKRQLQKLRSADRSSCHILGRAGNTWLVTNVMPDNSDATRFPENKPSTAGKNE